jgi:hypothetical protein
MISPAAGLPGSVFGDAENRVANPEPNELWMPAVGGGGGVTPTDAPSLPLPPHAARPAATTASIPKLRRVLRVFACLVMA